MVANPVMEKRTALLAQCPPVSRMPEDEASKLPINVLRYGDIGPEVLVVHGGVQGGLGGGPVTFNRQRDLASQGWRLNFVERPGFGSSPSRGVDDMLADAVWIAEMLGDGAHLVGHSWGGAEALLAAHRRPEAVRSLVLVEPALQTLALTDSEVTADPVAQGHMQSLGRLMMSAASPADYGLAFARGLGPTGGASEAPDLDAIARDETRSRALGCALLQARMAPPDVLRQATETMVRAGVPVLVISGGWSQVFDIVGDVVARLTKGRHVTVASPNHFPQAENPDEFNRIVSDFMRGADAKRGV